ncbi:hypothetical protein CASFOL_009789 [Castilleja foliolosa]|uniref:Uncharacterized protein n=1 Tax=Castilleja foliolosa TaxID=1961234 RepID=A0ABD3DRU2_9LAMI
MKSILAILLLLVAVLLVTVVWLELKQVARKKAIVRAKIAIIVYAQKTFAYRGCKGPPGKDCLAPKS